MTVHGCGYGGGMNWNPLRRYNTLELVGFGTLRFPRRPFAWHASYRSTPDAAWTQFPHAAMGDVITLVMMGEYADARQVIGVS